MIDFMKKIAMEAGSLLREAYHSGCTVSCKGGRELVTDADLASEELLRKRISENFPDHNIMAEEKGGVKDVGGYLWIIDPLDGTNNFARSFPMFSVSIGLLKDRELIAGVVYEPLRDELFWADESEAYLNDSLIHVSDTPSLSTALLATGFPYDMSPVNEKI
jgi:myo-inositol-1(or 4)-monophosphatase